MDADVAVLVEAIEESFGVKFNQGELTDDSRADEVCNVLRSRLGDGVSERCFTSVAFWRLRRALVNLLNVPRKSVTPSTALEYLIPANGRRRTWHALSDAAGLRLPKLEYPRRLGVAIFWAAFVPPMLIAVLGRGGWWILVAIVAMPITASMLFRALTPFAGAFPAHSQTVGSAARTVVGLNYSKLAQELGPSRERELLEAFRYVASDVTDIEPCALIGENPRLIDIVLANDGLRFQV
jgi:hypothetical protein